MIGHHATQDQQPTSSRPRIDLVSRSVKHLGLHGQTAPAPPPGVLAAIRNLEDDVACYVCHNEERDRVRSFVFEALMRLAYRDDVENLLFNTHSNGTVVAFDVLRNLPVEDILVDNVKNSRGGGLQAHNYWDNEEEFVK